MNILTLISFASVFFWHSGLRAQDFPYQRSKKDWFVLSGGIMAFTTSEILNYNNPKNLSLSKIQSFQPTDVNRFDRVATHNWNPSAAEFSDVPYKIMPFLPMAIGLPIIRNKSWDNALTLSLIYTEVFLFTKGVTGITKILVGRTRPYLYNDTFTPEERFSLQKKSSLPTTSFFSGHSSSTFAFAVLLSKTYTDIYGKNTWSKIIWISSLSLATATAYARVEAGLHYPSDVIVGALVGGIIGYGIPELHKQKTEKLSLSVFPGQFRLVYKL